jgi:hypothetical protein
MTETDAPLKFLPLDEGIIYVLPIDNGEKVHILVGIYQSKTNYTTLGATYHSYRYCLRILEPAPVYNGQYRIVSPRGGIGMRRIGLRRSRASVPKVPGKAGYSHIIGRVAAGKANRQRGVPV